MSASIHTVSLSSPTLASDLLQSCTSGSGFFYLSEHDIPQELIAGVFGASEDFFCNATLDEKKSNRDREGHTGWTGVGEEVLNPDGTDVDSQPQGDLKESFYLSISLLAEDQGRPPSGASPQTLPPTLNAHSTRLTTLITHCRRICLQLLSAIEESLNLQQATLTSQHTGVDDRLRLISYPSQSDSGPEPSSRGIRAGQHTDYGSLTLLFQSTIGGLQVFDSRGKEWKDVLPKDGCLVVNVADALEFWLRGLFESSLHRVVEPRRIDEQPQRLSMAYFLQPDPHALLSPLSLPDALHDKLPSHQQWTERCQGKGIPLGADGNGTSATLTGGQHLAARLKASYS